MGYFKVIDKFKGPYRLFIGGVHGKEGLSTIKALSWISDDDVQTGQLVIYNCDESKYISTLNPLYYQSEVGKEILDLIHHYHPDMYIETHCYKNESYGRLIDPDRMSKRGVPPLIELEEKVLIGSVSPQIRTRVFNKKNVCITLEMPCNPSPESLRVYVNFLKIVAAARDRSDLENRLTDIYPQQVETARRYAREIFGDYPPF
jgi:hypothetical protein